MNTGIWFDIKRTVLLASPIIIGNMANMGMNFIDTVMAGRLGAVSLGAIAIGGAVWSAVFLFVIGVMMAVPPAVSHLDGAEQKQRAGAVTRQGCWLGLLLGLLIWFCVRNCAPLLAVIGVDAEVTPIALQYLSALSWGGLGIGLLLALRFFSEGVGKTGPTMWIGFMGVLMNVPANYIFMYGKLGLPAMGAVGCGWSTSLIYWTQFIALLIWVAWRKGYRPYAVLARFDWPNWLELKELLRVGLPVGGMIFVEGSLFVGAALLIGSLGHIPIAAHQIAINFSALCFMVPLGLGGAITVRVGNALGRQDPIAARLAGQVGIGLTLGTQSVAAALMLFAPAWVVGWYTTDTEVIPLAISLLMIAAIFQFPDGIQAAAGGALRGYKDTRIPMVYTVIAYWIVGMPLGWWLTFRMEWGAAGMWTGMIAGLTVAAWLLGVRFWRTSRRLIENNL